jgi:hypothetical protein
VSKAKSYVDPEEFEPFKRYLENRDALTKHVAATDLAYALAVCDMSDIVLQTDGLQSISSLRETLIGAEIAKAETGGRSVSGLINVLKSVFSWPYDLYTRPYYENGVSKVTGYSALNEIREVRNALAHSSNQIGVLKKSTRLKFVNGRPVIDKEYLDWAEIVLSAIAHGISKDVVDGRISIREVV